MATEKRMISPDAFWDNLDLAPSEWVKASTIKAILDETPTVDAVEVVRCKDCRHYVLDEFDGCYICLHICKYVKPNFGCVDGERKDNERKAD